MIDQNTIDEVRQRTDIVDVISGALHLEKKGAGYWGLCPFHNEKTPSFHVDPARQIFHCFGCGEGGNVFTFLQKYDNLSFPEAVEQLAERAGVVIPDRGYDKKEAALAKDKKERLLALNKAAAVIFYRLLREGEGKRGYDYFAGRGLSAGTMRDFGLGFAPLKSGVVTGLLREEGFSDTEIIEAGLGTFDEKNGLREKFWNRVMFPIMDMNGKVIGFGGRVLGDGEPKYLNSPETPVFDKSRNLYGLHIARKARKGRFILCEGYMDVIAMHQAGFSEAVASLGTAFTNGQANIIKRYTDEVILSYDSDTAGSRAAIRAAAILRDAGLRGRVLNLSPHKDPDEFILKEGTDAFEQRLREAENPFFFELRLKEKSIDMKDAGERTRFHKELAGMLSAYFTDPIERENYLKDAAVMYGVNADDLRGLTERLSIKASHTAVAEDEAVRVRQRKAAAEDKSFRSQRMLLTWMSTEPGVVRIVSKYLDKDDFTDPLYAGIASELMKEGGADAASLITRYEGEELTRVSEALNERIPAIEKESERNKALRDLILDVMRAGTNMRLGEMEASDGDYLRATIEGRQRIDSFARLKSL